MNSYMIETVDLTKKYQDQFAVKQLNLHVPKGQIYGLLGRNGAGKTTTMKLLLGLVRPTGGKIHLFGEEHSRFPKQDYNRIGSMIEAPAFYENLTARENLQILARLRGQHRKDTVERALSVVGLQQEEKKQFRRFSVGMRQRLGLAAALMHEPELLILDEPMNGLDPIGIQDIRAYLLELCRNRGTTILISSHVLSEIEQLADRIGIMHKGSLLEETGLQELNQKSRRYVEFEVSDVNRAALLLEREFQISDYTVLEGRGLRIYEKLEQRAKVNQCFVAAGIVVDHISIYGEKLEAYVKSLIGGGGIG